MHRIRHFLVLVATALSLVLLTSVALGAPQGIAVLAAGQSRESAFVLARAVYASHLRPASVDEAHARILAGEPPAENAPADLRDLAALREAIAGDDAPSRRLLASIAHQLGVSALLVLTREGASRSSPNANGAAGASADAGADTQKAVVVRLFLADDGEYDAARYEPDPARTGPEAWQKVIASLERRFDTTPVASSTKPAIAAPSAAVHAIPLSPVKSQGDSTPFYASPWFWGAVGAAVLLGGGIYLLSRDTSSSPIHLRMNIPQ
ncbi:MAG: hypothetical protein FWD73_04140 [Polyangiaceae bacterium]|nr:hypothetical protein [Polyangiaceae bacterium]